MAAPVGPRPPMHPSRPQAPPAEKARCITPRSLRQRRVTSSPPPRSGTQRASAPLQLLSLRPLPPAIPPSVLLTPGAREPS